MRTKLAQDLGLEFPIFAFTHCRDVAAAVSKAGGLGVLGVAGHSLEHLRMELEWIGEPGRAGPACRRMLDAARVILAADILGACERAIELAVAYAKERRQFERVIGSFQAVKHLCAEMVAELEPARALVWYAAHAFDAVPEEASLVAHHAKAHLSEIGRFIVRTATEVHGGIGFTDEQNLHYWFKRVGLDRQLLGSPELLREQAARLQGWID